MTLLGNALEFIGLCIAIRGVASLKKELFEGHPLPLRAALDWFDRRVLGRERVVFGKGTAVMGGLVATAELRVEPPRPADGATADEWVPYLLQHIESVERRFQRDIQSLEEGQRTAAAALDQERSDRQQGDERLEEWGRETIGGSHDGRGLDLTWWGLTITMTGVGLQILDGIPSR